MVDLTRPIIGIENRTAQEVFDIMCDRFRMSEAEAEALSRTGAVKVSREEAEKLCARLEYDASWDKCGSGYYSMKRQLSALEPAAPKGEQEAARIGDAVLAWMIKYDLLDGEQEYYVADVIAVLDGLTPPTRPAEQAVTEAMVEAAARAMCAPFPPDETIYLGGYYKRWETHMESAALALKAAMEAGR